MGSGAGDGGLVSLGIYERGSYFEQALLSRRRLLAKRKTGRGGSFPLWCCGAGPYDGPVCLLWDVFDDARTRDLGARGFLQCSGAVDNVKV